MHSWGFNLGYTQLTDRSWRVRLHDPKIFNGHATPHQVSSRRPWDSIWEGVCFLPKIQGDRKFSTTKKGGFLDLTGTVLQLHHNFWCGKKIPWFWRCVFGEREIWKVDHKSITFDHKMRDEWCLHLGGSWSIWSIHQISSKSANTSTKSIVRLILPKLLIYIYNGMRLWDITKYQRDGWLVESSKWVRPFLRMLQDSNKMQLLHHVGDRPGHDQLMRFLFFFLTCLKWQMWAALSVVFSPKENLTFGNFRHQFAPISRNLENPCCVGLGSKPTKLPSK